MSDRLRISPHQDYEVEYILMDYNLPLSRRNIKVVKDAFKNSGYDFRNPFSTLREKREFIDKIMNSIKGE